MSEYQYYEFRAIDRPLSEKDCDGESLSLKAKKQHIVLEFLSEDEGGDEWTDGEHWMASLISIRAELMRGDTRALYLGWLASFWARGWLNKKDLDGDDPVEPPVPPGLAKLSAPLQELASFLRVDDELIEAAAAGNDGEPPAEPSRTELARWVKGLSASAKDAYLLRFLAEEGDLLLRTELTNRFRKATVRKGARPAPAAKRRTVAQLLAARDAVVEGKKRKAATKQGARYARAG